MTTETPVKAEKQAPKRVSVQDDLRRQRKENLTNRETTLPVNGWSGKLEVQYGILDFDEVDDVAQRVTSTEDRRARLYGCALSIARACKAVMYRAEPGEDAVPLHVAMGGDPEDPPVRWDRRLAEILELPLEDEDGSVQVVLKTFDNDLAVIAHHNQLMAWMEGQRGQQRKDFAGK